MVKNPPANSEDARDMVLRPGSGRSPEARNGNPLQYPYLGNPMDRGVWPAIVHGVAELGTNQQLNNNNSTHRYKIQRT